MSLVIGTAGHIDHGKTSLLRALTGIDADRLPEERARGMTIDLGYAHLALADGRTVDFVDVPGHDRLVGNMLVGAGEIDAALLVVAADDGPRAQTLEHLALLDALAVRRGLIVVTKVDLVPAARPAEVLAAVERLVERTALRGSRGVAVSSVSGEGMDELRWRLGELAGPIDAAPPRGRGRLAIDRVFRVRGRGVVVTGSLRGAPVGTGAHLRLLPAAGSALRVRVREVQVRGRAVAVADPGRTALNLAGIDADALRRGMVLSDDPDVASTERLLVALAPAVELVEREARGVRWPPRDGGRVRLHLGTDAVEGSVGRSGRDGLDLADGRAVATLRLARPIAAAPGDRFVLRRPSPGTVLAGGVVLDALPARGIARRRQTLARVEALAAAVAAVDTEDVVVLAAAVDGTHAMDAVDAHTEDADDAHAVDAGGPVHGAAQAAVAAGRLALHGALDGPTGPPVLAADVRAAALAVATAAVDARHAERPTEPGLAVTTLRSTVARVVRSMTDLTGDASRGGADGLLAEAVADGVLVRDGDHVRRPSHQVQGPDPALAAAMDRLEAALTAAAPPGLAATAAEIGCPADGIRALARAGRIVILDADLAWAGATYRSLAARALVMATRRPLTPAAFRDATGTSRRYALAILEDLDRRAILRRTGAGHVPGPKAPVAPTRPPTS